MNTCPHKFPSPKNCLDCMDEGNLPPPQRPAAVDGAIVARCVSKCVSCEATIYPGDEIVQEYAWIHHDCAAPWLL